MSPGVVMVVEDDDDVRDAVEFILSDAGYDVLEATNGLEALDEIEELGLPGLILLDMNMPIMNGWQLAHALRVAGAQIPVVVMTAALDAQRSADEIGAVDFIGKPFDLEALVRTVERHLARPNRTDATAP
jgi:CheY-like chemotaxis protein